MFATERTVIWYTRTRLNGERRKWCQNGRGKLDGYPKRPAKRTELYRNGTQIPHRPEDGQEIRRERDTAGIQPERSETDEAGSVQGADNGMAGGGAVFGGSDTGEDTGIGLRGQTQHRAGICTQQEGTAG